MFTSIEETEIRLKEAAYICSTEIATVVFLSAYGGMVSLAQWLLFGVAGFAVGNLVADSGRGIPRERLQRILEPTFSEKGGRVGMGLGLATSANVVHEILHQWAAYIGLSIYAVLLIVLIRLRPQGVFGTHELSDLFVRRKYRDETEGSSHG